MAAATAYVASGCTNPRFYFGGFFPRKAAEQRAVLESLRALDAALIFYESPNRIAGALESVAETFPLREVAVCRELTKLHEEVVRGLAPDVRDEFAERSREGVVKGEIAFVIDGPSQAEHEVCAREAATGAHRAPPSSGCGRAFQEGHREAAAPRVRHLAQRGLRHRHQQADA